MLILLLCSEMKRVSNACIMRIQLQIAPLPYMMVHNVICSNPRTDSVCSPAMHVAAMALTTHDEHACLRARARTLHHLVLHPVVM